MVNRFQDVCNSFIASVNSQPVNMPEFVFRLRARPLVDIAGEQFIRFKLFFHLPRGLFRPLGIMILKVHNRERVAMGNHIINEFGVRKTFVQGVNIITFDHGSSFLRNPCCGQDCSTRSSFSRNSLNLSYGTCVPKMSSSINAFGSQKYASGVYSSSATDTSV